MNLEERLWPNVDRSAGPDGCWLWTAGQNGFGYGHFGFAGKSKYAHRAAYEVTVGPIPPGLHLDHLCRNRLCCNPAHLEPVTPRENLLRSPVTLAALNAAKATCARGHDLTVRSDGYRQCKTCRIEQQRIRRARAKAA